MKILTDDQIQKLIAKPEPVKPPRDKELTWCEFCKGYYIEELHVERWTNAT